MNNRCEDNIEQLMIRLPKYEFLTANGAVPLLLYDLGNKMERIRTKQEIFEYNLSDIKKIILNTSDAIKQWAVFLKNTQDELLKMTNKKCCSVCTHADECSSCIINTISEWNMQELVDNLNLEYPLFSEENAIVSYRNKATDQKLHMLVNILNTLKNDIMVKKNEILCDSEDPALSMILGSEDEEDVNGEIIMKLLKNYKVHQKVYRDHAVILTKKFNYILHPRSIDFFEDLPESETEENPTFFSGRDVEFMHYGKKVKK